MSRHYTCGGCKKKLYGHPIETLCQNYKTGYMGQAEKITKQEPFCSDKCVEDANQRQRESHKKKIIANCEGQINQCKSTLETAINIEDYQRSKRVFNIIKFCKACVNFVTDKITKKKYQEVINGAIEYATESEDEVLLDIICRLHKKITLITE